MKRFALIPLLFVLLLIGAACGKESKNPPMPDPHDIQGITFVTIPGGTFRMGNVENTSEGYKDEKPVHKVTLTGFEMSVYEITNAQYAAYLNAAKASGDISATSSSVTGAKGAYNNKEYIDLTSSLDAQCWMTYSNDTFSVVSGHENWPVVWVTWYGSKAFALFYGLDLPTESEWEYACRGGQQYKYGTDDGTLNETLISTKANYYQNGPGHPVNVGSYPANPFGLHDMSGNVGEWCNDWEGWYQNESATNPIGAQTGSSRVFRGGGWYNYVYNCRSASRGATVPEGKFSDRGFRVVHRPGGPAY